MAKIVELIGPPGVGKSTLYSALIAKWQKGFDWIPDRHLVSSCTRQKLNYNSPKEFALTLLTNVYGKPDKKVLKEAGQRFVDRFPEFMDFLWEYIHSEKRVHKNSKKDLRFETAMLFYDKIQKTQIMLESDSKKIVLHDAGIINWIVPIIHDTYRMDEEKDLLYKFIETMYLPYAMIYVLCDTKENVKRLSTRKRKLRMHSGLDINELERSALNEQEKRASFYKILESLGIPILKIDSSKNIEDNVSQITAFLNNLKSSKHFETTTRNMVF
jgi:thymidylate kinase